MSLASKKDITNQRTLLSFMDDLSVNFENFKSLVVFTTPALHKFIEIMQERTHCKSIQMEPFDDSGRVIVTIEYYPEDYLRVDLRVLFEDRKDGAYHLCGFTRYAVDQDTTALMQKEFPQVGVRIDRAQDIDSFFDGCVDVLVPRLTDVEIFDV